ncbi:MAG: trypsin-like serine peptidase [Actinomycetota bacterium]
MSFAGTMRAEADPRDEVPLSAESTGVQMLSETEVAAYWTAERMATAKAMPLIKVTDAPTPTDLGQEAGAGPAVIANAGGPGAKGTEKIMSPQEAQRFLGEPEPLFGTFPFSYTRYRLFPDTTTMYLTFPHRTVGKLFFTRGGSNFVCSGSSINSTNRSVVWTAGHCVATPGIGFHTNFLFAPARRAGSNLLGTWTARQAFTLNGWFPQGKLQYDHGALVMNRGGVSSQKINDAAGFLGFVANIARGQHWHPQGYPAAPRNLAQTPPGAQFDGEHQEICAAAFAANDNPSPGTSADPATIGVGCDKTGGTSGGPWTKDFSGAGGATNLLNGNNSYRYTGPNPPENLKLFSPYFTTGAVNLRNQAQAVTVP